MMRRLLCAIAVLAIALPAEAGPERIEFPAGYTTNFLMYQIIERPDRKPNSCA